MATPACALFSPSQNFLHNFLAVNFDYGWPSDPFVLEAEMLEANGVDGRRWREERSQSDLIQMRGISDAASYFQGITISRYFKGAVHKLVNLDPSFDRVYRWKNIHIESVSCRVIAGKAVGTNATSGSSAIIISNWTFYQTDPNAAQTA